MSVKLGIMQGRLSHSINNTIQAFPEKSWIEEFELGKKISINSIEWIFDTYEKNPIMEKQIDEINNYISKFQIKVNSICADYFMTNKLFNEPEQKLLDQADAKEWQSFIDTGVVVVTPKQALKIPKTSDIWLGATPKPVQAPAVIVFDDVTNG